MNFSDFDTSELATGGVDMTVLHPATLEETEATIKLCGTDSEQFKNATKAQAEANASSGKKKKALSREAIDEATCQILADCTLEWSNVEENGKTLPFTRENALALYRRHAWLREQVNVFIGDRANFFPKSSKA